MIAALLAGVAASAASASAPPQVATPVLPPAPAPGGAVKVKPATSQVSVHVTDLRSDKGQVIACITAKADRFPDCEHDPDARHLTVPAAPEVDFTFAAIPGGRYAIALIHDENGNGKLDKALMIPREGFGFSRDAPVRMGPPSFEKAAFEVAARHERQAIRMRYLL